MFGSQVASHDHCLLYSASLIKTNKQTTVKDVIAFYLQTLYIWKTFVNLKRILSAHLLFWRLFSSPYNFQLANENLFLPLSIVYSFFYSWQINLANMIYPIRAPMALFLPVGSLWKDWLQLKPACGRRSNFAHAQRVDAVGWQRKDWVQKRCPLTHCQDLALGDLSRSAYIHVYLWCCNKNKAKQR